MYKVFGIGKETSGVRTVRKKREKQKYQEDIDIKNWRSLKGETRCGRVGIMGEMDSCLDFCSCNKPKILGR